MSIIHCVPGAMQSTDIQADNDESFETIGFGCQRRLPMIDPDYCEYPDDEDYDYTEFERDEDWIDEPDSETEGSS